MLTDGYQRDASAGTVTPEPEDFAPVVRLGCRVLGERR